MINSEIFKREIEMCCKLAQENGRKCSWGECEYCGVIPLLYKLHTGEVLENKAEIKRIKNDNLNK